MKVKKLRDGNYSVTFILASAALKERALKVERLDDPDSVLVLIIGMDEFLRRNLPTVEVEGRG